MILKISILAASFFLAVTELINEAIETSNKIGTLGMQGLLALMLVLLIILVIYQEKKRTADRLKRDDEVKDQYKTLLAHHDSFVTIARDERINYHAEIKQHNTELRGIAERSVAAMQSMATSTDALREFLKDRNPKSN